MKFIKVRFTEWRDGAGQAPGSELTAAMGKIEELNARDTEVRGDILHAESLLKSASSDELRSRLAGSVMEADNIFVARKAALAALAAAGEASAAAMRKHAMVGSFGYQVIDEARMQVTKITDANGADLPRGAVYGYEIADANPPDPAWALDVQAIDVKGTQP